MKKVLKISSLEVKSFVTGLENENGVKGGVVQTEWCTLNIKACENTQDWSCQTQDWSCQTQAPVC